MNKKRENIKWVYVIEQKEARILLHELDNGDAVCVEFWDTENYINGLNDFKIFTLTSEQWEHIKEPDYKPYTELTEEVRKKLRNQCIVSKKSGTDYLIVAIEREYVRTVDCSYSLRGLFKGFTFLDGSPIGEEVRED